VVLKQISVPCTCFVCSSVILQVFVGSNYGIDRVSGHLPARYWPVPADSLLASQGRENINLHGGGSRIIVILIELVGNAFSTLIVGLYYADVDNIK
jgi:hypothetical protein